MKKKFWIPIISVISAIAIIISFNVLSNNMKSYDINDYEVIEIYYDNTSELREEVRNEETEGIRSQFESYDGSFVGTNALQLDYPELCFTSNVYSGGYKKLEIDTDRIAILSEDTDKSPLFGVYDGNEAFCNYEGYHKYIENNDSVRTAKSMKRFAKVLMSEKKQEITDKKELYEYTTLLTGSEPEKTSIRADGKTYNGYDQIFTKIEFVDQGETRLVKISTKAMSDESNDVIYYMDSYYKIVLKKDNSEFEKDYNEIYEQVKDVEYVPLKTEE